jgi:chemotaxis protein CheX
MHPFLESASTVIRQVCQVEISQGVPLLQDWTTVREGHTWIRIGMTGHLQGDVLFGLEDALALRIVSAMMGGYPVQEMNELGKSAISELGNMISGNASTLLSNQGILIDITPPALLTSQELAGRSGKALMAALDLQNMGRMEIQLLFRR